jgi:hypothetical protein
MIYICFLLVKAWHSDAKRSLFNTRRVLIFAQLYPLFLIANGKPVTRYRNSRT